MDYGSVLSRAVQIGLKHPGLWLFGFFVALGAGSVGLLNPNIDFANVFTLNGAAERLDAVVQQLALAVPIFVALSLVGLLAQGCLIAGAQQVADESRLSLSQALRLGASRFISLLLLSTLLGLPIVLLAAPSLFVGLFALGELLGAAGGTQPERLGRAFVGLAVLCGVACIVLPYALFASGVQTLGERAIIVESQGALGALRRGTQLLFREFIHVLLLGVILFVILSTLGFLAGAVVSAPLGIITVLFAADQSAAGIPTWVLLAVSLAGLLGQALLLAPVQACISVIWTLAYREFIRHDAPAVTSVPSVQ
ncbi:MAG: hypothetical protein RMM31_10405, partial [Anaerolineae bacterium]|nr:hypothetical protein [Anaerolineae bacterium]